MKTPGTYYIPEDSSRTVIFPALREGNDESDVIICDDRSTLIAPCYVEEADSDDLLMLKQYDAGTLIGNLRMLYRHDLLDPGQPVEIKRLEHGGFEANVADDGELESADDAM